MAWCVWHPILAAAEQPTEQQWRMARAAVGVWAGMALFAIAIMGLGAIWFVIRYRRLLKSKEKPRTKYHDMRVEALPDAPEDPMEPPETTDSDEDDEPNVP